VLYRPQYARLQVGTIKGKEPQIKPLAADALSQVPYAEPSWLAPGFSSPYYNEGHRRFQKTMRKFVNEVVLPDAIACEENGRRISQQVVDELGCVLRAMVSTYTYSATGGQRNKYHRHASGPGQASEGEDASGRRDNTGGV